jgi:VanZ family protein
MGRLAGAWAPPAAWAALLFTASSLPLRSGGVLFPHADTLVHGLEYAVLGFLTARALRIARPAWSRRDVALAAGLLGAAYGLTDEAHQAFVPERSPEWSDLAADAAGSLLGAGLFAAVFRGRATSPGAGAERPAPGAAAPGP